MKLFVDIAGSRREVELPVTGNVDHLEIDGNRISLDYRWLRDGSAVSLIIDGITYTAEFNPGSDRCDIQVEGHDFEATVSDERSDAIKRLFGASISSSDSGREIKAPMPGLVVKLQVAEGDTVDKGQGVIIVEAMKMENEIQAQTSGVIDKIKVKPGQAVNKGELLVVIK